MTRRPLPPSRAARPARGRRPFGVDRIVVLRIAAAAVVVAFLYLILKVSMIAFGGGSAREAKRIEQATDPNPARTAPGTAAPPPAR